MSPLDLVTFESPWSEISADDYYEEALIDGTELGAVALLLDFDSGRTVYYGFVGKQTFEDDDDEENLDD